MHKVQNGKLGIANEFALLLHIPPAQSEAKAAGPCSSELNALLAFGFCCRLFGHSCPGVAVLGSRRDDAGRLLRHLYQHVYETSRLQQIRRMCHWVFW